MPSPPHPPPPQQQPTEGATPPRRRGGGAEGSPSCPPTLPAHSGYAVLTCPGGTFPPPPPHPLPPSSRRRNRTTAAGARGRAYIAAGAQPPSSARLASAQRPLLDRPASRTTKEGPGGKNGGVTIVNGDRETRDRVLGKCPPARDATVAARFFWGNGN